MAENKSKNTAEQKAAKPAAKAEKSETKAAAKPVKSAEKSAVKAEKPETKATAKPVEKPAAKAEKPAKAAAKPEAKAAAKPAAKATAKREDPADMVYHISKRKEDRKWQVKAEGAAKALKLFWTQDEAIEYAKSVAGNQEGRIVIHKEDGSFRKLKY